MKKLSIIMAMTLFMGKSTMHAMNDNGGCNDLGKRFYTASLTYNSWKSKNDPSRKLEESMLSDKITVPFIPNLPACLRTIDAIKSQVIKQDSNDPIRLYGLEIKENDEETGCKFQINTER